MAGLSPGLSSTSPAKQVQVIVAILIGLSGCTATGGYAYIDRLENEQDWSISQSGDRATPFLEAYREGDTSKPTWVYIEGDGNAWINRYRLSSDPTPDNPVALKLALSTHAESVLYLGRPCQYLNYLEGECVSDLWSSHRYSKQIVDAFQARLDQYQATQPGLTQFILVGFSGGGVLAALIAEKRMDVAGLITVASNLDTDLWTNHHKVIPLFGSLNPALTAKTNASKPQVHFVGNKDHIVPVKVVKSFIDQAGLSADDVIRVVEGQSHSCCWDAKWLELKALAELEFLRQTGEPM